MAIECNQLENHEQISEITDTNMFVYMGMIEQRINELLQARMFVKSKMPRGEQGFCDESEEESVE